MPKVSVVMAAYNHVAFVREAVQSVLSQSFGDLELVITDDGSSDGTAKILDTIKDPRVKLVVFEKNRGACVAINDAIMRSSGEYISVINSDDIFLPGKLEGQVAFLDAHREVGAVFGLPQFIDEKGAEFSNLLHPIYGQFKCENRSSIEWLKHFFYFGNCLCHPTVMLRKSCYDQVGLFDPLLMQLPDLDMWVRICHLFKIHVVQHPVTAFRVLRGRRNVSAPSKEKLARHAWELFYILRRFAALTDKEIQEICGGEPSLPFPPRVRLALEAVRIGTPGYKQFGLSLLRECIRDGESSLSPIEYFNLVGAADPFAIEYQRKEYQLVKHSKVIASARAFIHYFRS